MSKKLLFSGLASFTLMTSGINNASEAFSINNKQFKQDLAALSITKNNQKVNDFKKFNFANHLFFKVLGSRIIVQFTPQDRQKKALKLDDLAAALGYQTFNWVNYVQQDPHGIADYQGQLLSIPYNDPPPGGYQYDAADAHPFYWDIEKCENCRSRHFYQHPLVKQNSVLTFEDSPTDYRLKPGEKIEFVTHLVGIKTNHSKGDKSQWEILSTFKWQLTNDVAGNSQISLIAVNLQLSELSPSLLAQIKNDGGIIPELATHLSPNQNNFDNRQHPQQNHQNQHLDSHL